MNLNKEWRVLVFPHFDLLAVLNLDNILLVAAHLFFIERPLPNHHSDLGLVIGVHSPFLELYR